MINLTFTLGQETFSIWRLPPHQRIDWEKLTRAPWYSITRTGEEISIVAPATTDLGCADCQEGWSCLKIEGPLTFGMTGIIAGVASTLAETNISIFTVSTYDTDYFFVRTSDVEHAATALVAAGHVINR